MLEQDGAFQPGTASSCATFKASMGSDKGWCVGDGQTMPNPGTFDDSPFAIGRGFDILMRRDEMRILWMTTDGTPGGNENLAAAALLAEIRQAAGP